MPPLTPAEQSMKTPLFKFFFIVLILLTPVYAIAEPLRFGTQIIQMSPDLTFGMRQQGFEYLLAILGEQLGQEVQLVVFKDGTSLTEALDKGTIDFGYVKIVPYALAKSNGQRIEKLLTVVTWNTDHTQKETEYPCYIIAQMSQKSISSFYDLEGKRFGFTKNSASGFVYPVYFLQRHGIDYRTYFREYHFYNNHLALYDAFKADDIDAAATWDGDFNLNKNSGDFKIVTIIPGIPNPPIVASGSLPAAEKLRIKQALLKLPPEAFAGVGFIGLEETSEDFYSTAIDIVRQVVGSQKIMTDNGLAK